MAAAASYTVALPPGLRLLNANERLGWRKRNDITQAIVDAAIVMTRKAKIPPLERVTIVAVLHPADTRRRDPHNWYPSIKAAIDGVVRAGRVLADDDAEHVLDVSVRLGEPVKGSQLVLHIHPAPVPEMKD
jgi:crossover junction endodeoxyribonuclease RusA